MTRRGLAWAIVVVVLGALLGVGLVISDAQAQPSAVIVNPHIVLHPQAQPSPQPTSSSASATSGTDVATTAPAASAPGSARPTHGPAGPSPTPPGRGTPATPTPSARSGVAPPFVAVKGVATWYCWPLGVGGNGSGCTVGHPADCACGAAGPALRAALGDWRGRWVRVNGIPVRLIDWCACGGDHVIDVYHATWITIPHPSAAIVTW